jgi:Tfp pilus assembly protein PilV
MIETAIAMVIIMIVCMGAAKLFIFASNYNSGAEDKARAMAIAQREMERYRALPFDDASLNVATSTKSVVAQGRSFTVQTTICANTDCGGSASLKIITIAVQPLSAGQGTWTSSSVQLIAYRASTSIGIYLQ